MSDFVLLIRHAEKPLGDGQPFGVDDQGVVDGESLTPRGWQRAGALVPLFAGRDDGRPTIGASGLPVPDHLFASQAGPGSGSRRSIETLTPTAARLRIDVDTRFRKPELPALATAIGAVDGVVLVAWEHRIMPELAGLLTGDHSAISPIWPDERYDVVWVFERTGEQTAFRFRQLPQMLLAGDSPTVLALGPVVPPAG